MTIQSLTEEIESLRDMVRIEQESRIPMIMRLGRLYRFRNQLVVVETVIVDALKTSNQFYGLADLS